MTPSSRAARTATCRWSTDKSPTSSRTSRIRRRRRQRPAARTPRPLHPGSDMCAYYVELALRSFKRNPGLTALMVFAIALGISVCMITLTTYRAAAANPAGDRSGILFAPSIDSWDPENAYDDRDKTLAPTMLTYRDARALY